LIGRAKMSLELPEDIQEILRGESNWSKYNTNVCAKCHETIEESEIPLLLFKEGGRLGIQFHFRCVFKKFNY